MSQPSVSARRPLARVLMVQGTSSHAGKSTLVAALCRIFAQEGWSVAPFKAQNMSLNAAVTPDGAEIGRAQMLQAQAARVVPSADMNPILLKPQGDSTSQVVVLGKPYATQHVRDYYKMRDQLWPIVTGALGRLRAAHDLVVIEGAGSPAEINLRDRDIVNMQVALYANAPVLLVGDIERGGVFASLVGTMALLAPEEQALVKGFVINKFRGDISLFEPGPALLEARTGVPTFGVLPYITQVHLPEEDSLGIPENAESKASGNMLDIVIVRFPHLANFDDFDPLQRDPRVRVRYVTSSEIGTPDLIILPGSKTTVADLQWLRDTGLADNITRLHEHGTPVLGICGGFQMLGHQIRDPHHIESSETSVRGLAFLPVETAFQDDKTTHQVQARVDGAHGLLERCDQFRIRGYEIHMGVSVSSNVQAPFTIVERSGRPTQLPDGAQSADGWTVGTYMHGIFHNPQLREQMLSNLAARKNLSWVADTVPDSLETDLDTFAGIILQHLDLPRIHALLDAQ